MSAAIAARSYLLPASIGSRFTKAMVFLTLIVLASVILALASGTQRIEITGLFSDSFSRSLFFRLRLPRVLLGLMAGASLGVAGGALQALFRNPLADPYTLGVSGGGALGASVAIALGWSAQIQGVPLLFLASFAGAAIAVAVVRTIARSGLVVLPGALLLSGVAVNLIAFAGVTTIQYLTDPNSALHILRWLVGSLDIVGLDAIWKMLAVLAPAWLGLLAFSSELNLIAMDADTAVTLGINVRRCEAIVHVLCALIVGVTVAAGGAIGFVGLIVPHFVRMMFGEDLRIVLPGSLLAGGAFLVLTDALARVAIPSSELPVGAITGLLGGPVFLWLLRKRQQYSAI